MFHLPFYVDNLDNISSICQQAVSMVIAWIDVHACVHASVHACVCV